MSMKVKKNEEDEDQWDIYYGDKVVGKIVIHWGQRRNPKILYVNERRISEIKNQTDAIEKLEKFFQQNKKDIESVKQLIEELEVGMTQVKHQICIDVLQKKKEEFVEKLNLLISDDLI